MNELYLNEILSREISEEQAAISGKHGESLRYAIGFLDGLKHALIVCVPLARQEEKKTPIEERLDNATHENFRLTGIVQKLLDHCDKESGECSVCSKIVCPFEDEMHFHHDGCPSCFCHDEGRKSYSVPAIEKTL